MIKYLHQFNPEEGDVVPYCVVGSGAAGIGVAISLARSGNRVIMVDAGDRNEDPGLEDTYSGQASPPHPATFEYRRQRLGGTTHLWGGRCVPLDELDMEVRSYVPHSGWPITYEEMARYLPLAMDYCDAGLADFNLTALGANVGPLFSELPLLSPEIHERVERYSLPTDFARKFGSEMSNANLLTVLLRAKCTKLNLSDDGSVVESVTLSDGVSQKQIRASKFILCGGGLETTRLLLIAQQHCPAWQRFEPTLGRYYSCHYDSIFGELIFKQDKPFFDFQKTHDGVYARRKLQFSADYQSRNNLLNSAFRLHFPPYGDQSHGSGALSFIFLAKSVLPGEYQDILNHGRKLSKEAQDKFLHLKNIVNDFPSVIRFGYEWLVKMKLAKRRLPYTLVPNANGSYPIEFNSEQIPFIQNRVGLLSDRDRYQMPKIEVHWQLTNTDVDSGVRSFKSLQSLISKTRHCQLLFDHGELREQIASALPVGGHHMGTTRMGDSVKNSVVNSNCQVHGVNNLYIASSSVFPTCGHANPTLTIVALALRLADHLASVD